MLPRISGNGPLFDVSTPSSDAPGAAGADPAPAPLSASHAAATPAGSNDAVHDVPAVQTAIGASDDPETAAARRFWLPNDVWSSITAFTPRRDLLNLRTTNSEVKTQADRAVQSLRISSEGLQGFIDSDSFKNIKILDVSRLDQAALDVLIAHLAAHPRPEMTIKLDSTSARHDPVTPARLAGLSGLSLKALVLELGSATSDQLEALAACRCPIDLNPGLLIHPALDAASRLPTLRRFVADSPEMTESIAARFAAHGVLEALSVGMGHATPPPALQLLAAMPTLRELHINGIGGPDLDVATAQAIAANPGLENLKIVSDGPGLDEDGFAALSRSRSLTTLRVPLRAAMLQLVNMTSVTHLTFDSRGTLPYPMLDAATSRSIAALPALESVAFPIMQWEPGALIPILKDSTARALNFWEAGWGNRDFFDADERTALMANTRLKTVGFLAGFLGDAERDALLNHPTIEYVKTGGREYIRGPNSRGTLTLRQA